MITDFDYNELPASYTLCLYEGCPRAAQCLRCALGIGVPAERTQIRILSPAAARQMAAGGQCPYFAPVRKVRFVRGIDSLLTQIRTLPYDQAVGAKNGVMGCFGTRTYYRVRSGERLVSPDEQAKIARVLRAWGLREEPVYDNCIYTYDLR